MTDYVPQTWNDGSGGGTPITAARLTVMETGIDTAHSELTTHEALAATAHGAVSTATADTLMRRDANGRTAVATPSATGDASTKGYVDTAAALKTDKSTLTTKGDLYVATAASTIARQAVGTNNQVLVSDSAQTNGIRWATPAEVLIASYTGDNTNGTITFSGIPGTFKHLKVEGRLGGNVATLQGTNLTINDVSTTDYFTIRHVQDGSGVTAQYETSANDVSFQTGTAGGLEIYVPGYTSTSSIITFKVDSWAYFGTGASNVEQRKMSCRLSSSGPVTKLVVALTGGFNFNEHTHISLYGLN